MSFGRRVLVPVANPATVAPLLELACRLADGEDGCVIPVTVVSPKASVQTLAEAHDGIAAAERAVVDQGGRANGQVVTCDHPAEGVLEAIHHADATLVMMGWRGRSSTSDIFGRLIDTVVGRSSVPLAIVRLGATPYRHVLFPVGPDHLLPGGGRGLDLAVTLARRLSDAASEPTTVLRTGTDSTELPEAVTALSDRIHHDRRRIHQAVAAAADADDLVVAAVAPTVSGLRAATTHLAWAAPEATLLVAVDVGPTEQGLVEAVDRAGRPAPPKSTPLDDEVRIAVTACLPEDAEIAPDDLDRVLQQAGDTDHLMAWWPTDDPRPHLRATVTVRAPSPNAALARVMTALHEASEFRGAELTYDLERSAQRLAVTLDDITVARDVEADAPRGPSAPHPSNSG